MKRYFQEISVTVTLGVVLVALAIFAPGFYQPQPLLSLATREAPSLVVTHGWPLWAVVPAAGVIGALLGAFNGVLVAWLRLPSIVVTLATMVTLRQGLNLVRQGEFVNLPDSVQWFGLSQAQGQSALLILALLLLVVFALAMRHL